MTTNDIYKISENGEREYVGCYGGNHSAEYALYLYWCQNICHFDYMNLRHRRKFTGLRTISKTMRSAMFEHGTDTYICSGTKEHGYNATVGDVCSKFDYEPNYPTK
ncbi:MAG: hypothetical protein IJ551_09835 [Prevotella sp.]|nr:hypothetical protein [Prevotella sp.]